VRENLTVKLDRAELAVEKLRSQNYYKTQRELARILIVKKSFALAHKFRLNSFLKAKTFVQKAF
jgi:hypothetical protein